MLDPKRERIQDDLRGLVEGEVFANSIATQVYATDGSLFEVSPICVVCPKTRKDVVAVVQYARKHGLTIHPRGSGSSTVGAALGEGIILDMSRFMRRMLFYQPEKNLVNVQAGMLCSRLNEILRSHGRQLLPNVGTSCPNTVGGLLSVDGYAGRWLSFGRLSDWLVELEIVTANGNILTFSNQEAVPDSEEENDDEELISRGGKSTVHRFMLRDSVRRAGERRRLETGNGVAQNSDNASSLSSSENGNSLEKTSEFSSGDAGESLAEAPTAFQAGDQTPLDGDSLGTPEFRLEAFQNPLAEKRWIIRTVKRLLDAFHKDQKDRNLLRVIDKMGYRANIQNGEKLNMARLIAGSEGTLGVITSMKLQLPEIPKLQKTLLLLFDSMEKAMQAVPFLLPYHPEACELLDRRYLHLATERDVRFDAMFPSQTEAALLVELSDDSRFNFMNRIRSLSDQLVRQKGLAFQLITSVDEAEANFFRDLVGSFEPSVQFGKGKPIRNTMVEDVAVLPGKLHDFFLQIQQLLRRHELTAAFHAHAIQGQVKLQPLADLHSSNDAIRVLRFARDYYRLVRKMNGTVGTENGLGMGWLFWMPFFAQEKHLLTNRIKRVFDPNTLFQPGKMGTEIPSAPLPPELFWRRSIRPKKEFDLDEHAEKKKNQADRRDESEALEKWKASENQSVESVSEFVKTGRSAESGDEEERGKKNVSSSVISFKDESSTKSEIQSSESGIMALEQVREILGNTFDALTEPAYGTDKAEDEAERSDEGSLESLTHVGLDWSPKKIRRISSRCHGCGKCRGIDILNRACPVFRYDCSEFSSPRAKAALMEGFVNEALDIAELGDEACRSIFHRCIQCHSCRVECRGGVDVPFLVRCAEESWAKARGLNFYETTLVRLDRWVDRFQYAPWLINCFFSIGFFRWFMEKSFGIARKRQIPRLKARSFLETIRKNPAWLQTNPFESLLEDEPVFYETATEIRGRAVYFLDTYANHFETEIAEAAVRILQHNRMSILVPHYQDGSGITAVMLGRSDFVKKQVYRNAAMLADYVRQGYDVLVTEPTTALAFRWEYPQTYPKNEDIQLIAKHCFDVGEYLRKLHINQLLKLPQKEMAFRVGYHLPCRLRALKIGAPFVHLMQLIPGLEVAQSPFGCCGMGGFHGIEAENFNASMKIARPLHLWFRDPSIQLGATECSACKMQMVQNSSKSVFHPIQILAYAYGLLDNEAIANAVRNEEF